MKVANLTFCNKIRVGQEQAFETYKMYNHFSILFLSAPKAYHRDCECLIGMSPNHCFNKLDEAKKAAANTKTLWEQEYPDEPYKVIYKKLPEDYTYR